MIFLGKTIIALWLLFLIVFIAMFIIIFCLEWFDKGQSKIAKFFQKILAIYTLVMGGLLFIEIILFIIKVIGVLI